MKAGEANVSKFGSVLAASSIVTIITAFAGCASQTSRVDEMQPYAITAAQQRGSTELDCPASTGQVITKKEIDAPQTTGWYEYPHRSEYTVDVTGCGKRKSYLVGCDWRQKGCEAGQLSTTVGAQVAHPLATQLEPEAVRAAQQRGADQLACPAASAQVTRREAIEEGQATGWYDPPHRALYTVDVTGCGRKVSYLVSCDSQVKGCVTGGLQKVPAGAPTQLADKMQPDAVKAARLRGSTELQCATTTTDVTRKETIEESQTTGWYQPPYRALYTVNVSGCGANKTYLVACDSKRNSCATGSSAQ
jgi:hypothetical protein